MAAVQLPHFSMQVCDVRFSAVMVAFNIHLILSGPQ